MSIKSALHKLATAVLAAGYVCAVVVWFDSRAADLRNHERDIAALQGGLVEAAKINEDVQNDLIEDILDLDNRSTSSEADTRSRTTRELRNSAESTKQNIAEAFGELLGLVEETRAALEETRVALGETRTALEETQEDVDFLVAENEVAANPPPTIIVPLTISEAVVYVEELENLERDYSTCPTSPDEASKIRRILTRAMERKTQTGSHSFTATFNINAEGATEDIVVTGDGPRDLRRAVARYASALRWTVDGAVKNCEFKLKLDIE